MDPVLEIKFISSRLGSKPGTHKWEVVTAIFGWTAVAAMLGSLLASLLGYSGAATLVFSGFSVAITIAIKRDLIRIWRSYRED
jgi:hypothetical protein